MKNTANREFKVLTDVEHVLTRPGMYLGAVTLTRKEQWIYDEKENKFKYMHVDIVPALLKCASELIDNSIDVAIDTEFKFANVIKVEVDSKSIKVTDNGIGISCSPPEGYKAAPENTCACLAWTTLKSGTSFSENRNKIGTNGVGSSCVNVFSKVFIGISDDGTKTQTIECRDNLSVVKPGKIKKSKGKSGCSVYCEPDLERFGLKEIDKTHIDAIYQRLVNLSICYPKIQFTFNGKRIKISGKNFAKMFSENAIIETSQGATVCVFPNEYDEFKFYANVNGIDTVRGGTHVDFAASEICSRVKEKLAKKYKTIKPGDIKNKISLVVFLTGFSNPEFDSQTKESLANSVSSVSRHFSGRINFDLLAKQVLKSEAIIGPVVETFKIKEELKARSTLKQAKRAKVKSDKYFPGIGQKKYLFLVEGLSAAGGLMKCLGRDQKYYYALRGLALNVFDSSIQKIAANQEVKEVTSILGLDLSKDDKHKNIEFDKIVIATDNDLDGVHISSMLLGWWKKLAPNLFKEHRICKLNTPLVIIKNSRGDIKNWFYTLNEFKKWESTNKDKSLNITYLKGLGSLEVSDLDYIISKLGFDALLDEFELDENADRLFQEWLGSDAEPRKKYLKEYTFDVDSI